MNLIDIWKLKPYWSIKEAAYLFMGQEPKSEVMQYGSHSILAQAMLDECKKDCGEVTFMGFDSDFREPEKTPEDDLFDNFYHVTIRHCFPIEAYQAFAKKYDLKCGLVNTISAVKKAGRPEINPEKDELTELAIELILEQKQKIAQLRVADLVAQFDIKVQQWEKDNSKGARLPKSHATLIRRLQNALSQLTELEQQKSIFENKK